MICYDCTRHWDPKQQPKIYQDGYCKPHWDFHFAGMTNHQRMVEKKRLRTIRREYAKAKNPVHDNNARG